MYYIDHNNSYMPARQIAFFADTDADIKDLPTSTKEGKKYDSDTSVDDKVAAGSSCMVIGSSNVYMLNSNDEWKPL